MRALRRAVQHPDHVVDAATDTARDVVRGQSRDQRLPDDAQHDVVGQPVAQTSLAWIATFPLGCNQKNSAVILPVAAKPPVIGEPAA